MQDVVLVGDSIRIGNQQTVVDRLTAKARVWGPQEDGGSSENVLAHLVGWVLNRDPAVVPLNCGLHDVKMEVGTGRAAVALPQYAVNGRRIFERILQES